MVFEEKYGQNFCFDIKKEFSFHYGQTKVPVLQIEKFLQIRKP